MRRNDPTGNRRGSGRATAGGLAGAASGTVHSVPGPASGVPAPAAGAPARYRERHRPGFHFTPPENWINDPNGLIHHDGLYHLFYQYNPHDKVWGSMHWGHAVSEDLLHWRHRPVALHAEPDGLGFVFSGSAVVDRGNTTGFGIGGRPPLVTVFTHHSRYDVQAQSLAYSTDGGSTWTMYGGNPVIANPGVADFRDPKVFLDERSGHWTMALAAGDRVSFYCSPNLKEWRHLSDFARGAGMDACEWECPDLFRLPVRGTGEFRWVLLVSLNPGGPNGGSATRYFVGDFDGTRFVAEHDEPLWMDWGPDQYAASTWHTDVGGGSRRIAIGWMNNWDYANDLPTAPWRGAMTAPRELGLARTSAGIRLTSEPVGELLALRGRTIAERGDLAVDGAFEPAAAQPLPELLDVELNVLQPAGDGGSWTLRLFNGGGEEVVLAFDGVGGTVTANRDAAAHGVGPYVPFRRDIAAPLGAVGDPEGGSGVDSGEHSGGGSGRDSGGNPGTEQALTFRLLKDRSSVELFQVGGPSLLTLNYFTRRPLDRLEMAPRGTGRTLCVQSLKIHKLQDVWI